MNTTTNLIAAIYPCLICATLYLELRMKKATVWQMLIWGLGSMTVIAIIYT